MDTQVNYFHQRTFWNNWKTCLTGKESSESRMTADYRPGKWRSLYPPVMWHTAFLFKLWEKKGYLIYCQSKMQKSVKSPRCRADDGDRKKIRGKKYGLQINGESNLFDGKEYPVYAGLSR